MSKLRQKLLKAHTPGPWAIVDACNPGEWANVYGDRPICGLYCNKEGADETYSEPDDTDRVNARLIAAAPDMLRLLIDMEDNPMQAGGYEYRQRLFHLLNHIRGDV